MSELNSIITKAADEISREINKLMVAREALLVLIDSDTASANAHIDGQEETPIPKEADKSASCIVTPKPVDEPPVETKQSMKINVLSNRASKFVEHLNNSGAHKSFVKCTYSGIASLLDCSAPTVTAVIDEMLEKSRVRVVKIKSGPDIGTHFTYNPNTPAPQEPEPKVEKQVEEIPSNIDREAEILFIKLKDTSDRIGMPSFDITDKKLISATNLTIIQLKAALENLANDGMIDYKYNNNSFYIKIREGI